jgi:hypothetical protein
MKKALTKDQILIRAEAEKNNNKIRKQLAPRYKRIKREKKFLWRIYYKIRDLFRK